MSLIQTGHLNEPYGNDGVCLLMKSQTSPLLARKVWFLLMLFSCTRRRAGSSECLNKPGRSLGKKKKKVYIYKNKKFQVTFGKHHNGNHFHLPTPPWTRRCFDPCMSAAPHWSLYVGWSLIGCTPWKTGKKLKLVRCVCVMTMTTDKGQMFSLTLFWVPSKGTRP